jgi:hypothetical protein
LLYRVLVFMPNAMYCSFTQTNLAENVFKYLKTGYEFNEFARKHFHLSLFCSILASKDLNRSM